MTLSKMFASLVLLPVFAVSSMSFGFSDGFSEFGVQDPQAAVPATSVPQDAGSTGNAVAPQDPSAATEAPQKAIQETVSYKKARAKRTYEFQSDDLTRLFKEIGESPALAVHMEDVIDEIAEHPIDVFAIRSVIEYFSTRFENAIRGFASLKKYVIDASRAELKRKKKLSGKAATARRHKARELYRKASNSLLYSDGRRLLERVPTITKSEVKETGTRTRQADFGGEDKEKLGWNVLHREMVQFMLNCATLECQEAIVGAYTAMLDLVKRIAQPIDYNQMGEGDLTLLFGSSDFILAAALRRAYDNFLGGVGVITEVKVREARTLARGIFLPLAYSGYTSEQELGLAFANFKAADIVLSSPVIEYADYEAAIRDADKQVTLLRNKNSVETLATRLSMQEAIKGKIMALLDKELIARAVSWKDQPSTLGKCVLQVNEQPMDDSGEGIEISEFKKALDGFTKMSYVLRHVADNGRQATVVTVTNADGKAVPVAGDDLVKDLEFVAETIRQRIEAELCGQL